jgi:hypothetical protein
MNDCKNNYSLFISFLYLSIWFNLWRPETQKATSKIPENRQAEKIYSDIQPEFSGIINAYNSIRHDLKRNIDVNAEDFEKLFPMPKLSFDSYNNIMLTIYMLYVQMNDMKAYCLRLLL